MLNTPTTIHNAPNQPQSFSLQTPPPFSLTFPLATRNIMPPPYFPTTTILECHEEDHGRRGGQHHQRGWRHNSLGDGSTKLRARAAAGPGDNNGPNLDSSPLLLRTALEGAGDDDDELLLEEEEEEEGEPTRPPPPRPIARIDLGEFFFGLDKKWMAGGVALACGAASVSIRDLGDSDDNGGGGGDGGTAVEESRQDRAYPGHAGGGGRGWGDGVELVSPLVSRDPRGSTSRHPGWGFGYNGPDPRVGFEPQVCLCGGGGVYMQ